MDMIKVNNQLEIAKQFGFDDVLSMINWGETLEYDLKYEGTDCLYTDGDSGIMLIQGYSDMFPDKGISIYPVYGNYCEFHADDLMHIIKVLNHRLELERARWEAEEEEI